jgi:hypothetical protein
VLVRQLAVLGGAEKVTGRPGTGVQYQDDGRLRLQLGGDIDEHLDTGRVVAEVLHLREGRAFHELIPLPDGAGLGAGDGRQGHQACQDP